MVVKDRGKSTTDEQLFPFSKFPILYEGGTNIPNVPPIHNCKEIVTTYKSMFHLLLSA